MADIRKSSGASIQPARDPEPLGRLRELLNWNPFAEMAPVFRGSSRGLSFLPDFDVKETQDDYQFQADIPGVEEDDLDISVTASRLTISGKREEESEERADTYYASERSYGSFSRSFTLPEGTDMEGVQADLKSGVLTVTVPKKPEVQTRKVSVKAEKHAAKA